MRDRLREHPLLGDESRVLLLTCHGSMPIEEQVRVRWAEKLIFIPPPPGITNQEAHTQPPPPGITTKVIVAISMAETSITINDAVTHSFPYLRPFPPLSNFPKQKLIFNPPPAGVTKVILATNMAETSITINDVALVIDTGKAKETSYDAVNNVPCLLPQWVSKASVKQRRGRAGRVRPGVCFHLYPRPLFAALPDYGQPELLRAPLHSLCLQIKTLGLGNIGEFLGKAIQPPEPLAPELLRANAIELLRANAIELLRANAIELLRANAIELLRANAIELLRANAIELLRANAIELLRANAIELLEDGGGGGRGVGEGLVDNAIELLEDVGALDKDETSHRLVRMHGVA
ncbi:unnamed protein product [Closterium sp. NIES-65]|nr:unnamed protein product [Closterium sp. NIES-65]